MQQRLGAFLHVSPHEELREREESDHCSLDDLEAVHPLHRLGESLEDQRYVQPSLILRELIEALDLQAELTLELVYQRDVEASFLVGPTELEGLPRRRAGQLERYQHQRCETLFFRRRVLVPGEEPQGEIERVRSTLSQIHASGPEDLDQTLAELTFCEICMEASESKLSREIAFALGLVVALQVRCRGGGNRPLQDEALIGFVPDLELTPQGQGVFHARNIGTEQGNSLLGLAVVEHLVAQRKIEESRLPALDASLSWRNLRAFLFARAVGGIRRFRNGRRILPLPPLVRLDEPQLLDAAFTRGFHVDGDEESPLVLEESPTALLGDGKGDLRASCESRGIEEAQPCGLATSRTPGSIIRRGFGEIPSVSEPCADGDTPRDEDEQGVKSDPFEASGYHEREIEARRHLVSENFLDPSNSPSICFESIRQVHEGQIQRAEGVIHGGDHPPDTSWVPTSIAVHRRVTRVLSKETLDPFGDAVECGVPGAEVCREHFRQPRQSDPEVWRQDLETEGLFHDELLMGANVHNQLNRVTDLVV